MFNILIRTTLSLFTLACLLLSLTTNAINYSDCGTANGTTIWNARLLGCEDLEVCELVRGNQTSLDVDFQPDSSSNQTKMLIHGKIASLFLPFNFKQKDACQNSGLTCPLEAKNYTYHAEVDVKEIYPPNLKVGLRFKLVDVDSKKNLFCVLIPAKLV